MWKLWFFEDHEKLSAEGHVIQPGERHMEELETMYRWWCGPHWKRHVRPPGLRHVSSQQHIPSSLLRRRVAKGEAATSPSATHTPDFSIYTCDFCSFSPYLSSNFSQTVPHPRSDFWSFQVLVVNIGSNRKTNKKSFRYRNPAHVILNFLLENL